MHVLLIVVAYD